jgi:hypothetical protein
MLDLPVAFFNEVQIVKFGTEKIVILELVVNNKTIEKSRIFLSRGAMKKIYNSLKIEIEEYEKRQKN